METYVTPVITRGHIVKNVVLISLGFMALLTSFHGLSSLQSSLHQDQGMGTICYAVLYASLVLSALFLPKLSIQQFGHKRCLAVAMCGYLTWMAANGYAGNIFVL